MSTSFSFPLNDGPASGISGGRVKGSLSSGSRWIARLGVDVLLFKPFLTGVPFGVASRLGEGDVGAPSVEPE